MIELKSSFQKKSAIELLKLNKLPIKDVSNDNVRLFALFDSEKLLGCVGIEEYGNIALLRSLSVADSFRGTGLGKKLASSIESMAIDSKIETMYLLTETAEVFFKKLGYAVVDRERAPIEIQQTNEFSELCSTRAILMKKDL